VNWLATIKLGSVCSIVQEFLIDIRGVDKRPPEGSCCHAMNSPNFSDHLSSQIRSPSQNLVNEPMARKVDLTEGVGDTSDRGRSRISIFNTHGLPACSSYASGTGSYTFPHI
jgi:hypothetical protein